MYLKALNVIGFKSFADKTQLQFHPGVTAIVGPNGCGKSNVLDSIRWVLGEQSAKALRGGQMQDVIFNGSDTRKPLGMAEVSLTFGDCEGELGTEYNEVTITRRLFRDGASEYEINKSACRLRDIHQLFMDTGVGRTAYSIMEQGKIDQILSARPEDRRAVFEEAGGITKYKSQKKEAMRKLEQTDANLLRLEDIIREVRRQINSLQRQASKAKRYQDLFAELKDLELRLARHQYALLAAEIASLADQSSGSREAHQQLTLAIEAEDQAMGILRSELEKMEGDAAQVREALGTARMAAERAAQREKTNAARVEEFSQLRENCRIEIAGTEEKIRIQDEQLHALGGQAAAQAAARSAAAEAYHTKDAAAREVAEQVSEKEVARAERNHELLRLHNSLSNFRNQLIALEAQQKNLMVRGESLRAEQGALTQRREEAEATRIAQEGELAAALEAFEVARAEVSGRHEAVRERQQLVSERQRAVSERQQAVHAANDGLREAERAHRDVATAHGRLVAKLDALKHLETSHAGSPPATQHLLACSAKGEIAARIQGTLSDHFQVTSGYEEAIALLLGEAINALVVDDRAGAEELLAKALAGNNPGRVFLAPLSLARPSGSATHRETGAARFIQAHAGSDAAARLLESLLSETHIVDDLTAAWELKSLQPQAVIAVRDGSGTLLSRAGLLQAGKASETAAGLAVFTRRNEQRELEEEIASALAAVEQGAARVAEAAEAVQSAQSLHAESHSAVQEAQGWVQEAQSLVQEAQSSAKDAEIAAATLRHTQQSLAQSVAEIDRNHERLSQEVARTTAQVEADGERRQNIENQLGESESQVATLQEALTLLQDEIRSLEQEEASLRQTLVESQIELASLTHRLQSTEQQQQSVQTRLGELRELTATRSREAEDYATRIATAEAEIDHAKIEQETAAVEANQREGELQAILVAKSEQQERISVREEGLRIERRKLNEAQAIQSAAEIKLTQRRLTLEHLVERVQQAYQLVLAELPPLTEEEIAAQGAGDWSTIEADVREKRERLDGMGPVNIEAIAEFEELQQRLTFLEGQETDLRNGKEQLLQAIQEINQTTEKMFAETFEQVKINFQQIFGELFGGGKATLVLSDDKDPLESGIEIVAKPPGKQPQSITLLSGGEKTMTAVALLFSIYMVKPSPFCVLDEMDAPLDESNINRFIKMVQRFTEHSQFVVITHNKRTISMADAIFGVTMQERGVSRLMSVKLTPDGEPVPAPAAPKAEAKAESAPEARAIEPGTAPTEPEEPALSSN